MERIMDILLTLLSILGSVSTVGGNVNCYLTVSQRQCFNAQGIDLVLPTYGVNDTSEEGKKNLVAAFIAQRPELLCAQQAAYKLALTCAMNQSLNCMPAEYKAYLPQPSNMMKIVDMLCETEINFECVKNKGSHIFYCGYQKGQEAFNNGKEKTTVENVLCKAFQFNAVCQRRELRSCGCSTVRTYEIISRELMYPPACPRPILPEPPFECNKTNPDQFIMNTGRRPAEFSAFCMSLSLVFLFYSYAPVL